MKLLLKRELSKLMISERSADAEKNKDNTNYLGINIIINRCNCLDLLNDLFF